MSHCLIHNISVLSSFRLSKKLHTAIKHIGWTAKLSYSKGRLKNFQVFPYLLTIFSSLYDLSDTYRSMFKKILWRISTRLRRFVWQKRPHRMDFASDIPTAPAGAQPSRQARTHQRHSNRLKTRRHLASPANRRSTGNQRCAAGIGPLAQLSARVGGRPAASR